MTVEEIIEKLKMVRNKKLPVVFADFAAGELLEVKEIGLGKEHVVLGVDLCDLGLDEIVADTEAQTASSIGYCRTCEGVRQTRSGQLICVFKSTEENLVGINHVCDINRWTLDRRTLEDIPEVI